MVVQILLYQTKQTKWCLNGVSKKNGENNGSSNFATSNKDSWMKISESLVTKL